MAYVENNVVVVKLTENETDVRGAKLHTHNFIHLLKRQHNYTQKMKVKT